jgi:acetyl esterase/lipase
MRVENVSCVRIGAGQSWRHSMKDLIFVGSVVFALGCALARAEVWQPSAGHTQVAIWPGAMPDALANPAPEIATTGTNFLIAGKPVEMVDNVSQPTMTVYSPKGTNTGVAIIVFPGGGYYELAIDLEGSEVCDWLTAHGMTGVLLKYRVPGSGPYFDKILHRHFEVKARTALEDAQRTMGLVRLHAAEWGIDPHKIGVLGFSAGGHLVADISTHFEKRVYPAIDAADKESCRPDFGVPIYPGHMLENTENDFQLNPKVPVTSKTPPMFIVQNEDDPVDEVQNSLVYYMALKNAKVPVEMHLYAQGGHAFGLRRTKLPVTVWPELMETWLGTIGMLKGN